MVGGIPPQFWTVEKVIVTTRWTFFFHGKKGLAVCYDNKLYYYASNLVEFFIAKKMHRAKAGVHC